LIWVEKAKEEWRIKFFPLYIPIVIPEGCEVYHSLEEALSACQNDEKVFIIGGGKVYEQCLDFSEEFILTEVNDVPKHADTFFPDYNEWKEKSRGHHEKDEKHAFDFDFVHYVKA